jgi:two-component system nitrogen regulation sensor histidine kinase GlnL
MISAAPDPGPFELLATGVAWLDASLTIAWVNPAFLEHTGLGWSRLKARTLAALQPGGAHLHERARTAQRDTVASTLTGATVCAAPAREVQLDFAFTPCAGGVLIEVHSASTQSGAPKISESLRGFAHEVRNPLAAISGAAQLLQQDAGGARQFGLAQLIRDEATRLAALTERLLGAREAMTTRTLNVHALLERAAEMLEAARMPVTLIRDYDPSLPAWHGDPDRLLQAVINLTRNAIEAHAQRIVLRSRAEAGWRDARGQRVPALRIEIEDDGDGVPAAIAQNLFAPMVSGRADGSGLGLALARAIAREHGGELTWSPRATGTCFVLLLPRHPRSGESE